MSCPAFRPLPTKSPVVPPKLPLQLLVSKYFTYNSFVYKILRGFSPISLKTRIFRRGGRGYPGTFSSADCPKVELESFLLKAVPQPLLPFIQLD